MRDRWRLPWGNWEYLDRGERVLIAFTQVALILALFLVVALTVARMVAASVITVTP